MLFVIFEFFLLVYNDSGFVGYVPVEGDCSG